MSTAISTTRSAVLRAFAWRHHHLLAGLLLLAMVIALRIPGFSDPLGIDEGGMTLIGADWLRAAYDGGAGSGTSLYGDLWVDRPPLIIAAYGFADLLGGSTAVRIMGVLAALSTAALVGTVTSRVVGRRAWGPTALVAGVMLCSPAIDGDRTAGELLAAVPSAISMALIAAVALRDRRERDDRPHAKRIVFSRGALLVLGGMAAASAPLVKQSALDAGVAAAVWFAWRLWADRKLEHGIRRVFADVARFGAGAALLVATTLALAVRAGSQPRDLLYALVGFRVDVLEALTSGQGKSPAERIGRLLDPALGSGLLIVAIVGALGLVLAPRARLGGAGAALLTGWVVGAVIGVSGGGYYWAHYLIQLAPPVAAAAGVALGMTNRRLVWTGVLVVLLATIAAAGQIVRSFDVPPARLVEAGYHPISQQSVVVVADAVRRNSRPDDRVAVLYARANVAYYAHRTPASPYLWSSMYRALPEARTSLIDALTGPDRAAWLVEWQQPNAFGMDYDGAMSEAIGVGYRHVAQLCGKPILVRNDRPITTFVLPHERCDNPGPEVVTGAHGITRGFE